MELVLTLRGDIGAGMVVTVYPLVGGGVGGVHSILTVELSLSSAMLSILTSLGASAVNDTYTSSYQWSRKQFCFGGAIQAGFGFGNGLGDIMGNFLRGPEV